ncbi:erythroid differentiation-related factor 1-like isoform X1 [Acipenser oxyrinchus oxyrinchus]|uniref:Erythroid differentiation-related factor 1-like isoform X1 n=1 Tax=Acipenser oxyrinchus oxyrinchus TaxID=40147 RepID=A0AAD8G5B0_ACIOX|nr:erythroid differentiation-related factor 1-like isoform X1 [Acipenser oxyrinchus oxyrinchus]
MTENVCQAQKKKTTGYSDRRKMNAAASDSDSSVSIAGAGENGNDTPLECREDTKHTEVMCLGSVNEVKSRAVVKYSTAPPPTTYALLQEKTDLKLPPANWLRESTELGPVGTTILGSSSKSKPFSSFGMAYDFIDSIGNDVDVVSDSENIKKLLKIPYSKSHVSMAVHRVGRTLLLDELDIQELFMRSSQTGDWNWLKEFYQRLVDQKWQRKKKSKEQWYQRAILSKFLYYSINGNGAAEPVPAATGEPTQREDEGPERDEMGPSWPAPLESSTSVSEDTSAPKQESVPLENTFALGHVSSTPKEQNLTTLFNEGENSQGLKNDFVRNILWTFEDIHMLVGTNMPIFGGGRYPAVSLRLRDNNKPINVLTGIDYWLDNLMCNVPELVMCFHVNGIVQKYEMIKTEDIPDLDNSTFSTKVVKDIAQNILSFLKSNCTKEGHTYWLFKASGSDIVKLYDLTTLCEDTTEEKYQNPFTLPVAVLLYKVASNMMMKKGQNKKHYGTIRTLLLNCIKLLDQERHPQIVASANFMLSELFQLDEPQKGEDGESLPSGNSEDSYSEEEEEEELPEDSDENGSYSTSKDPSDDSKAVAIIKSVGELSVPEKYKSTHQIRPNYACPVSHDLEERCRLVLGYVLKGLKAVDGSIKKESELPAADPNTPIPLKYEDITHSAVEKEIALFLDKDEPCQEDFEHPTRSGIIPGSWQYKMKLQLFLKASRAYYVLSDAATNLMKYGRALRYIKIALQCHDAYCSVSTSLHTEVLRFHSQCLSLCGDIQLMLAQNTSNRAAYLEEYNYQTKDDQEILHSLHRESSCQAFNMVTELATDPEHQLSVSCKCYEAVHDLVVSGDFKEQSPEQLNQVLKRLGNIRNEVGVFYMNQAATVQTERAENKSVSTAEQELWKKSFSCFEKGIKDFEAIGDATNTALLLCNTGRLMRICAQAHCAMGSDLKRGEFSPDEALYYNKAIDYYLKAMRSLVKREMHPAVWDSVNWELSTTYFTLATMQQDYAPLSRKAQEQIEREVTEAMMKSLKYCDLHTESARQPLYQYRAATIHHRLASMYHSCFRNQVGDEHLRKQHRGLAELHYNKAVKLFQILRDAPCELLRAQLERVAFAEFQMAGQSSNSAKLKTLSGALEIMTETKHAFQLIHKELLEEQRQLSDCTEDCRDPNKTESGSSAGLNTEEVLKLINVFEPSLSFLLLHLVKLMSTTKKKSGPAEEGAFKIYKQVYSVLLRADKTTPLITRVELILDLLDQLASKPGGRESGGQ